MEIIIAILAMIAAFMLWQKWELGKFRTTEYTIRTNKIKEPKRICVLSDLHCHVFGGDNSRLFDEIKKAEPDIILIAGDLIVESDTDNYQYAAEFIENISKMAPVYFARGNHEKKAFLKQTPENIEKYRAVEQKMIESGCHVLNNENQTVKIGNDEFRIHGLDIDLYFYKKGVKINMPERTIARYLGECDTSALNLLIAHNPAYAENYANWGADITVCGHNHGGLVCIPGIGSLISPQFEILPKYSAGLYEVGNNKVVVSRGLGTHTFNIRVFNRAEIVIIKLEKDRISS